MNNSKELKVKYHGNKEKPSRFKNRNVASMSKLGYRDDSPYNTLPYIDVHTPSGRIDMSGTGIPLWANGRILPPYSGVHQFDTTQVKEIPLDYRFPIAPPSKGPVDMRFPIARPKADGSNVYEKFEQGGSWLEQYQDKKSIVDTVKAKYASRPSSAPQEKQPGNVSNTPKVLKPQYITSESSTTDTNRRVPLEKDLKEFNYLREDPEHGGLNFTNESMEAIEKEYQDLAKKNWDINVKVHDKPATDKLQIIHDMLKKVGIDTDIDKYGHSEPASYNSYTRTVNMFPSDEGPVDTYDISKKIIAELPHTHQFDENESLYDKVGLRYRFLKDLLLPTDIRYSQRGTAEHEAHSIMEPEFQKQYDDFISSKQRTALKQLYDHYYDPNTGVSYNPNEDVTYPASYSEDYYEELNKALKGDIEPYPSYTSRLYRGYKEGGSWLNKYE